MGAYMKSSRNVVLLLLLGVGVLGRPEVPSVRVAPKPVSDCNLDGINVAGIPGSGTDQLIHCWNR
jgi:hypothetical protein